MKLIKPNKNSFVYFYNIKVFLVSLFFLMIILVISFFTSMLFFLGSLIFLIIVNTISIINREVRFNKEEYHFYKNKIVMVTGNIISDKETELRINNVTHFLLNLPYVQTTLFKTGNIFIDAAGSSSTEIRLSHVDNPKDLFSEIKSLMISNGFTLSKKKLIQKEKPDSVAVFLEIAGKILIGLFVVYYTLITTLFSIIALEPIQYLPLIFLFLIIALVIILLNTFRFMNIKRRTYYLYNDTIYYEDGFFTENYAYIPIENLSDTELEQNFITKLLNLYNIRISSRGQGNEIKFFYISNGELLSKNLDSLINQEKKQTKKVKVSKSLYEKKTGSKFSDTLYIDLNRNLFSTFFLSVLLFLVITFSSFIDFIPFTLLVLVSIFIIASSLIRNIIEVYATTYNVKNKSVESVYSFLTSNNLEFGTDNITSIKVRESFIDKFFNTYSLFFYSIGSNQELVFKNIKKERILVNELITKLGIKKEHVKTLKPNFDFDSFLRANLFLNTFFVFLVALVLTFFNNVYTIIGVLTFFFLYSLVFFYKKYYYTLPTLKIFSNSIFYEEGLLIKNTYYCLYEDVKDVFSLRYPWGTIGRLEVNIAGEIMIDEAKQVVKKVGFEANYYEDVLELHNYTDSLLKGKSLDKQVDLRAKPEIKNPLTKLLLTSFIIFPLILILPITMYITWLKTKRTTFYVEKDRMRMVKGILFRRKITILYEKVNHINYNKKFLNKIFGNGNVQIFTTGSGIPELTIYNIKDFINFYKEIEKKYKEN